MELNKSVESVVLKAQELRLKEGASDLYAEHILLILLKCLDESMEDAPELSFKDLKLVDKYASEWFDDLAGAADELEAGLGKKEPSMYESGMAMLERAGNLAPDGVVTLEYIMKAIEKNPSPLVEAVMGKEVDPYATVPESTFQPVKPPVHVKEKPPVEPPHVHVENKPVVEKKEDKDDNGEGLTPSQFIALLELMAHVQENKNDRFEQAGSNGHVVKKRTKMGLINYRGGKVAAAIQYFLLSIGLPFLIMVVLDLAFGWVSAPTKPIQEFIINIITTAGLFSVGTGIALLLGQKSNAFGNFLEMLCDLTLIYCVAQSYVSAWGYSPWPLRVKIGVVIAVLLCLIIRSALFSHLRDQGDLIKTKIMFKKREGTPGKVFFETVSNALILPAIVLSVIWLFNITLPGWLAKTLLIIAFFIVNSLGLTMWICLSMRSDYASHRKGRGLIKFCLSMRLFITPCLLVFFLGKIFAWLPFKKWIIIVMIVYVVIMTLGAIIYAVSEQKK